MGHYNFDKDLAQSQKDFELVRKFLLTKGASDIEENHDKRFDIKFTLQKEFTIEIKHDYMYHKTGNVAIEFESRGKPSGISTSTASLWGYILGKEFYVINTNALRKFLKENSFRTVKGGDDNTSRLYLIPFERFGVFKKFNLDS
jgi:hypothetical protein